MISRARPSRRSRAAVACAIGLASAAYVVYLNARFPTGIRDFDQVWFAARALWRGENPYDVVGPGRPFQWPWPLYYPATALVAALPLAALPLPLARVVLGAASGFLLAYGISRTGWYRFPLFVGAGFERAVTLGQFAPILLAAALLPVLSGLLVAKPNIGAALGATVVPPRRWAWAIGGGLLLVAVSFALQPGWLVAWRAAVSAAPHITAPILRPGGIVLALALLRWRRPEARMLLALACVPQSPATYELLPLFLVTHTLGESVVLVALSRMAEAIVARGALGPDFTARVAVESQAVLALLYLPCLLLVLRRPNTGAVPPWAERVARRLRLPGAAPEAAPDPE